VITGNEHTPIREGIMRLACLRSIPLALVLLGGCTAHRLSCDAHLTPINPPEPTAKSKPSEAGSP
jgi:hypothetical protein